MLQSAAITDETGGDRGRDHSGKLATLQDVRREMTSVYFAAKRKVGKEMTPVVASKLVFILDRVRACISESELEGRIEKLEAKLAEPNGQ